jgi:hypothetical protein
MSPVSLSLPFQEYVAVKSRVSLTQGETVRPLSAPFFFTKHGTQISASRGWKHSLNFNTLQIYFSFLVRSQYGEKWPWASPYPSVRPSVRIEQLGSHWTDFHEILYLSTSRKYVEKIPVSLKSDKKNGYFTWRPKYIMIVLATVLVRMEN